MIDSLQLTDRLPQVATPANWVPGEKVMILPTVTDQEADQLFPKGVERVGMPSGINYVRTTTDYEWFVTGLLYNGFLLFRLFFFKFYFRLFWNKNKFLMFIFWIIKYLPFHLNQADVGKTAWIFNHWNEWFESKLSLSIKTGLAGCKSTFLLCDIVACLIYMQSIQFDRSQSCR